MPPKGTPISTSDLSWSVAKKILPQSDIERLACAMLNTEDIYKFDIKAAAEQFGGAKPDSFKRQIWVIAKRVKEAGANGLQPEADDAHDTKKGKDKTGSKKKRGRHDEEDDKDGETSPKPKPVKKIKKTQKTVKSDEANPDGGDVAEKNLTPVKSEYDSNDTGIADASEELEDIFSI